VAVTWLHTIPVTTRVRGSTARHPAAGSDLTFATCLRAAPLLALMDSSEPLALFNAIASHLGRPTLDSTVPPQILIRETRSLLVAVQSAHHELVDQLLLLNSEPFNQHQGRIDNAPQRERSNMDILESPSRAATPASHSSHTVVDHSPTPELLQLEEPTDTASQLAHAELRFLRPMMREQAITLSNDQRQEQASLHDLLTGEH